MSAPRVAVAGALVFIVAACAARPWVGGDTPFVLDATNALIGCISARDFVACRHSGHLDYWGLTSPMGDWPLLQHIPDVSAVELGFNSHPDRTRLLALLSTAAFAASIALARVVLTRAGQAAWFWGFVVVAISGPTLAYARTTAQEMLATGLLVCLVAATLLPARAPLVGLAAAGACLTKETAYPFVAALGVLALVLARRRTGEPIRRHLAWGAAGMAAAFVAASLFNVVRYGSVLNTNYLEPQLHTHGATRIAEYTAAVLVSPSGGVLPFWPAGAGLVLVACLLPFVSRSRSDLDLRPALVLGAVVLGLAIGFASWWTPFGWSAYGPRLMLPWVLPLVLVALVAYGDALGELARRLLQPPWRLVAVFALVVVFALPHVGAMWRPGTVASYFAQEHRPCDAPWRGGEAQWTACQHRLMWLDRPMPLYAARGVTNAVAIATASAVALGILGCLITLRRELPARRRVSEPGRASRARAVAG